MITPGFFGFFNTYRGLVTAQNALNTVNNNISNANTKGYNREVVNITEAYPYQAPSLSQSSQIQIGQGSVVSNITRVFDSFLATQFQNQNSLLGLDTVKNDVLNQIQGILSEPSDSGINDAVNNFFNAAQEMSQNPQSDPVRQTFLQAASDLTTVVSQVMGQLTGLRTNLVGDPTNVATLSGSQASVTINQINEYLQGVAQLNQQIVTVTASGAQPNDLMDQRDQMLDDLSQLVDISVTRNANGTVDVGVGSNGGVAMVRGGDLLDTLSYVKNPTPSPSLGSQMNVPGFVKTVKGAQVLNNVFAAAGSPQITSGKLGGILQMGAGDYGFAGSMSSSTVMTVMEGLTTFMTQLVNQVNTVQLSGLDINGNPAAQPIFTPNTPPVPVPDPYSALSKYTVNPALLGAGGTNLIAAAENDPTAVGPPAGFAGPGDGRNALKLAQLQEANIPNLSNLKFSDYWNSQIAKVGVQGQTYSNRLTSQQNVVNAIDQQRQSTSGVDVDQETIDLLRYQRAFEASSKVMQALDDIVKSIIGMV